MRCRPSSAFLVTALILIGFAGTVPAAEGVDWKEDYRSVMRAAEKQNKLIMIDFYTSWCVYCRQLDNESFEDERIVGLLAENFVVARLDAEIQKAAARRYRPDGYPTVIFATADGDEILRFSGYREPDQVYEIVKTVREVGPRVTRLQQAIHEDRKSFEAHRELGELYAGLGASGKACHHLERARRYAPDDAAEAEVRFLRARVRLAAGECGEAERMLRDLIDDAGRESIPSTWEETLTEAREACAEEG